MKKVLMLSLLFLLWHSQVFAARLVDERFEKTGYEETWTITNGGAIDEDSPIEEDGASRYPNGGGTMCGEFVNAATAVNRSLHKTFGIDGVVNVRFWINFKDVDAAAWTTGELRNLMRMQTSTTTNVVLVRLLCTGSNVYEVYMLYHNGSALVSTGNIEITEDRWYRLEVLYDDSDRTGNDCELSIYDVDGNEITGSPVGADFDGTREPYSIEWGNFGTDIVTSTILFDQLVVESTPGDPAYETGEDVHTFTKTKFHPDTDVLEEWTPLTGTSNVEMIDEVTADDDTTYVSIIADEGARIDRHSIALTDLVEDSRGKILGIKIFLRGKAHTATTPDREGIRVGFYKIANTTYYDVPWGDDTEDKFVMSPAGYEDFSYFSDWNYIEDRPWIWKDLDDFQVILRAPAGNKSGGYVTQMYTEVVHGEWDDVIIMRSTPVFLHADTDDVKVYVKAARRPFFSDTADTAHLRVEYKADSNCATVDMALGTTTTSSVEVGEWTGWTHVFYITGLSVDQKYCFDFESSDDDVTFRSMYADWDMSYYPEVTTQAASGDISYLIYSDQHGRANAEIGDRINTHDPDFVFSLGDLVSDLSDCSGANDIINCIRSKYNWIYSAAHNMRENCYDKRVFMSNLDDHDFWNNNSDKFEALASKQISMRTYLENRLGYKDGRAGYDTLSSEALVTGTVTSEPAGALIEDTTKSFSVDNIHALATYGGALAYNITDNEFTMVTAITDGDTLVVNDDIFENGDSYEIYNGFFRSFTYTNRAEFTLLDMRSARDLNNYIPGVDPLDGVMMVNPTTLANPKDSGAATSVSANKLIQSGQNFLSTVSVGDIVKDADSEYAQVIVVDSDIQLSLGHDIITGTTGFSIYESGASEGDNSAGHRQRDWGIGIINASTQDWKIILTSVPFNEKAPQANENWSDYDALNVDTGTAESGGNNTLADTDKAWVIDEFIGRQVVIISGTGLLQERNITSNTATELTVSVAWGTNPDATSVYEIYNAKDISRNYFASEIGDVESVLYNSSNSHYGAIDDGTNTGVGGAAGWAELIAAYPGNLTCTGVSWSEGCEALGISDGIYYYGLVSLTSTQATLSVYNKGGTLVSLSGDNPLLVGAGVLPTGASYNYYLNQQ